MSAPAAPSYVSTISNVGIIPEVREKKIAACAQSDKQEAVVGGRCAGVTYHIDAWVVERGRSACTISVLHLSADSTSFRLCLARHVHRHFKHKRSGRFCCRAALFQAHPCGTRHVSLEFNVFLNILLHLLGRAVAFSGELNLLADSNCLWVDTGAAGARLFVDELSARELRDRDIRDQ